MTTRLLIADDHSQMRMLMRDLCTRIEPDLEIIEALNGKEAVAAYDEFHPDFTIMDIEMPEQDGISATREICTSHPNAKIIVISSHDGPSFRTRSLAAGAISFVSKDNLSLLPSLIQNT